MSAIIGWFILDRPSAVENAIAATVIGLGSGVIYQLLLWSCRFIFTVPKEMQDVALGRIGELEARVEEIERSKPKLRLREPGAVHIHEDVAFFETLETALGSQRRLTFSADFLKVSFINEPVESSASAEAKAVLANVQFYRDGRLIRELDGRWSESTQPGTRIAKAESTTDLLRMDFGIGDARTLDIAMKSAAEPTTFMFCNDNYHHPQLRPPGFALEPGTYSVRVRLRAVNVDEAFEFSFRHNGAGTTLEIVPSVRRTESDPSSAVQSC